MKVKWHGDEVGGNYFERVLKSGDAWTITNEGEDDPQLSVLPTQRWGRWTLNFYPQPHRVMDLGCLFKEEK